MLLKRNASPEEKGDMVGSYIQTVVILDARQLTKEFPQIGEGNFDLLMELFGFYMHLANRIAFRKLGSQQNPRFSNRMIVEVANTVTTSLSRELSSVQVVAELRDKYNEREDYYAQFRKLVPDANESQKNTLFYEFAKVIFHNFVNTNKFGDLVMVQGILSAGVTSFLKTTNEVFAT